MAKSSIHFDAVKVNSEAHNYREVELDYIKSEVKGQFENWASSTIAEAEKSAAATCRKMTGRKLQKNTQIIREAVVNLNANHTMDDLHKLGQALQEKFGIQCFQIHLHRDEGHYDMNTGDLNVNHHAHMLFKWQDANTGKTIRLDKKDLSQLQTFVAQTLGMERGELRVNSNTERLEAVEYKYQQKVKEYDIVQADVRELYNSKKDLEQKKNRVIERIEALRRAREEFEHRESENIRNALRSQERGFIQWNIQEEAIDNLSEAEIERAISIISAEIERNS